MVKCKIGFAVARETKSVTIPYVITKFQASSRGRAELRTYLRSGLESYLEGALSRYISDCVALIDLLEK